MESSNNGSSGNSVTEEPTAPPEKDRSPSTSSSHIHESNRESPRQEIHSDSRAAADAEAKEMVKRGFRMLQDVEDAQAKASVNSGFRLLQDVEEDLAAFIAGSSNNTTKESNQEVEQAGITNQDGTIHSQQAIKDSSAREITADAMAESDARPDEVGRYSQQRIRNEYATELAAAALAKAHSNSENAQSSIVKENYVRYHEENGVLNSIQSLPMAGVRRPEPSPGAYAVVGPRRNDTSTDDRTFSRQNDIQEETAPVSHAQDQPAFMTNNNELVEAHLVSENTGNDVESENASDDPSERIVVAERLNNKRTRWTIAALVLASVGLLAVVISLLISRKGGEEGTSSQVNVQVEGGVPYPCFQSNDELKAAVRAYHQDNSPTANVSLKYGWPIGSWCVTPVNRFTEVFLANENGIDIAVSGEELFYNMSYFHEDIGGWDMSNALEMEEMLRGMKNLSSSWGIQRWNTSSMTSLKALFMDTVWTEPAIDLGAWDVSRVQTLNQLFRWSTVSTANISGWDTRKVQHIGQLAEGAGNFNDDISNWNTENVVAMYRAFKGASSFQGDLSRWNTSSVVKLNWAFDGASSFNSDISGWGVSRVDHMLEAFKDSAFNQDISSWDVSSVTDLRNLFFGASSFRQDLCAWGLRLLPTANISGMFVGTNCPNQTDPVIPRGPFCFNCD